MGFNRTQTVYKLVFDDEELEGLVVRVRRGSVRERFEFDKTLNKPDEQIDYFARFLVEWNVEDDTGAALPLTAESLWSLEAPTLHAMLHAWYDAVSVPAPLETPSNDGEISEVASIPTETLSGSLAS